MKEHESAGSPSPSGLIESLARRPQGVALFAILVTAAAAWLYLLGAGRIPALMTGMDMADMDMAHAVQPAPRDAVLLFVMWSVMMVAMMLPSAAPMILLFSRVGAARSTRGERHTGVVFFAVGYLLVWFGFSGVAAGLQWTLHSLAVLSADMRAISPFATGVIMIGAGVYQWLPLKQSCLRQCRSPFSFMATSWREGRAGALQMGLGHGVFCVGCCWTLMALLFVGGVMNLAWVAAISILVLIEKVVPAGVIIGRVAGVCLIGAGIFTIGYSFR